MKQILGAAENIGDNLDYTHTYWLYYLSQFIA